MKLENKVAIITGAASGIGKEIAIEFAREGAKVCIADLALDAATATANEINASVGNGSMRAMAVAMNVTDEAQVEAGVAATVAQFGGVDILISNAGIQIISPLVDYKFEDFEFENYQFHPHIKAAVAV